MKTTTKLWIIGSVSGSVALVGMAFTLGYVSAVHAEPAPQYSLIAATCAVLGVLSIMSCLSAVIIRVLQEDQLAVAQLGDVSRRFGGGGGRADDNVRRLR